MIRKTISNLTIHELLELFRKVDNEVSNELELLCSQDSFSKFSIKSFVELGQIFFYKVDTIAYIESEKEYLIKLSRLNSHKSFHKQNSDTEKYGVGSEFFNINKIDEISFLYYYQEALKFIDVESRSNILNIGVNKADEFSVLKDMLTNDNFRSKNFLGIDYSSSAIEYANKQFVDYKNVEFLCADVNKLEEYDIARYDLIISIGTLQSSNINFNAKFMELYQNHLQKNGAIILGFPNCRWIDSEMIYGAKAPNYSFNEMGLVLKDIHFCKKYLQQKGYRVVITGKDYLFLSARPISKSNF